jgi:hypothetical protein
MLKAKTIPLTTLSLIFHISQRKVLTECRVGFQSDLVLSNKPPHSFKS